MTMGNGGEVPSYLRRLPRWYDGAARLLDVGETLDRRVPSLSDDELLAEDLRIAREDLRRALAAVTERRDVRS
jgi:transcription initiation factor IIE alpha subunit